ncbi:capsule assembly Wzi family protein [Spirosoma daeguense]
MKQVYLVALLIGSLPQSSFAQINNNHQAYVELGGLAASAQQTPFWLRANQFGIVPNSLPNATLRVGIKGSSFLSDTTRKAPASAWIFRYGAEVVGNAGKVNELLAPEYYFQLAHRQLQLEIGRKREIIGLVDTTLTSGSYAWSGNALPIPKIRFGTKGFAPLGRRQWLAINAFIAHGWFANTAYIQRSFLHQKSVFFRIGKPTAKLRLYMGLNHHVQWGGHSDSLDYRYAVNGDMPSQLRDFPNILFAVRSGGLNNPRITSFDYTNLYGNHIGSVDIGLELRLPKANVLFYHQNGFDDATGVLFRNLPDGLNGLRIRPLNWGSERFRVINVLLECLLTMDQGGPIFAPWNGLTGNDNYFNNGQYLEGWAHQDRIIGTPFITRKQDLHPTYQNTSKLPINNNRLQMYHLGLEALAGKINLLTKISYSRNYGLYDAPFAIPPTQWSLLMQMGMPISWLGGSSLTVSLAADLGQLYHHSVGGYVGLRKTISRN